MRNRLTYLAVIVVMLPVLAGAPVWAQRENSTELYQKGARLALDGQLDKAILVFNRVVDISPYYCLGHYGLGKAYLYKYGMVDEAIKHLKTSVKLDRKLVKGYFYLGIAYFMAKKYPPAAYAFKMAYNYDNSYSESLYNLGVVYEIMGKSYESMIYFNKYLGEKDKEDEEIIF